MNKKRSALTASFGAALLISSVTAVRADEIDELQKEMLAKITVETENKQITSKDAAELRKDMSAFDKAKNQLRAEHSDVLSGEDEAKLRDKLNLVSQKLAQRKVPKKK